MAVGELRAARGLGHDPCGRRIIVEPTGVIDQVRQHVRHPAGGGAIDGVHTTQRAADDNLLHLAIVDPITVLVAHDRLHAGFADKLAHRKKFGARERDGFLESDQLGAALDPQLEQVEPYVGWCAEAENFGFRGERERTGITARRHLTQFAQRALQTRRIAARYADQLKARIGLEESSVMQAPLAHADDEHSKTFHSLRFKGPWKSQWRNIGIRKRNRTASSSRSA